MDSNYRDAVGPRANLFTSAEGVKKISRWRDDYQMKERCGGVGWHRGLRSDQPVTPPIAYVRHDGAKVCSTRDRPPSLLGLRPRPETMESGGKHGRLGVAEGKRGGAQRVGLQRRPVPQVRR